MTNELDQAPNNDNGTQDTEYFIPKAVPLAKTDEFTLFWANLVVTEARIGLVSDKKCHPFADYVKRFLTEQQHLLIQFTTEDLETTYDDSIDIWSFEMSPTTENETEYEKVRMQWAQAYIKMLCLIHGKTRQEFIPPISYRPHMEGPMGAYIRTIEEMEDCPDKQLLLAHLEKLKNVKWRRGEKEGFVYNIEGQTANEMLESFFLGAWSIYIYATQKEDIIPIFYLIQFVEEMMPILPLSPGSNETIRQEILQEVTHLLSDLTFPVIEYPEIVPLACMMIQSPRLFPIPVARATHVFFEKLTVADCAMQDYVPDLEELEEGHVLWSNGQHLQILKLFVDY